MSHLLSLSALHAAAPGVLDIVFGADGDFEGAPRFTGPVAYDVRSETYPDLRFYRHLHLGFGLGPDVHLVGDDDNVPRSRCALDLRIPSVAARLAGLCNRAMLLSDMDIDDTTADVFSRAMWGTARNWGWRDGHAAFLASLTLTLAPRIAALRSPA